MRTDVITTSDGFSLAVQMSGRRDGPVLLLLPGQANNHHWWDQLRGDFNSHFCVLTWDYRGTGSSRGPIGAWTTTTFADDAAIVLASYATSSASVYGTSMGGRVAQMLAARHPHLVHRLVLACTSPGGPHAHERGPEVRRTLADPDDQRRHRALMDLFYTPARPRDRPSVLLGDPSMSAQEARAHLRASNTHDAWDLLPTITAPGLVLHGQQDLMVPAANTALLAQRLPDAQTWIHPDGRHGFFEEFAAEVTPVVTDFLSN